MTGFPENETKPDPQAAQNTSDGEFSLNWVGVEVVPHAPAPDQRGASRFWSQRRQKAPQPQEQGTNPPKWAPSLLL